MKRNDLSQSNHAIQTIHDTILQESYGISLISRHVGLHEVDSAGLSSELALPIYILSMSRQPWYTICISQQISHFFTLRIW